MRTTLTCSYLERALKDLAETAAISKSAFRHRGTVPLNTNGQAGLPEECRESQVSGARQPSRCPCACKKCETLFLEDSMAVRSAGDWVRR